MTAATTRRAPDLRRQLLRPFLGSLAFSLSDEFILLAASIAARCRGDLVLFYRQLLEVLLGKDFDLAARDLCDLVNLWECEGLNRSSVDFPFALSTEAIDKLQSVGFIVSARPPTADRPGWCYQIARNRWDPAAVADATTFTPGQCRQMERRLRRHLSQLRTGGVA